MALVRNRVWTVNNISAETANHFIKDKKFQKIINKVLHKNNTLISIDLDSLWHLLKKTTNVMTHFYSTFFFCDSELFNNILQKNYNEKRRNRRILQNEKITTDMQFDHFDDDGNAIKVPRDVKFDTALKRKVHWITLFKD